MGFWGGIVAAVITAVASNDNTRYEANTAKDRQKEAIASNEKMQANALKQQKDMSQQAMPSQDSGGVMQAKQQSIAAQIARRGRASTILTGDNQQNETLGG